MTDRDSKTPVTVLGLGAMGTALARAFLATGHPTTVWNRTPGRADALVTAGAVRAENLPAAASAGPLVVICVLDHRAVHELLDAAGDRLTGRTVVNLTSSTPEDARETARRAAELQVDYLDGAIMVPTPLVGRPESLLIYSGDRHLYDTHRTTLAALGGRSEHLGADPGLASLYEIGMLDLFFAGMTAFLHAAALVAADGVPAKEFLPYAEDVVAILPETLRGLAHDVDSARHPGDDDNLEMDRAGLDHIVHASEARGVDPALPALVRGLAPRAIDSGHGRDGFSRVVQELRRPAS
ncbi:MAG: NAD(P)-dependent oxidoreductase [Streptosporangiales bacterium]|nr:NAD(P)-dependent oxidoreductase [Streptosporangiales bacterium]